MVREVRPVRLREIVQLPWELPIEVNTVDTVGIALVKQGLYDILTTEIVWRLTRPGDRTVDVGANIGYFTSLLAARAGRHGAVYAWEPHPETFCQLQRNAKSWQSDTRRAKITLFQAALSDEDGMASLSLPPGQQNNFSLAFLASQPDGSALSVRRQRLAPFLDSSGPIGVMKLDAESHESQILKGAGDHLHSGSIRDIVFEEHSAFPARSHEILLSAGYQIYWFEERLRGPNVIAPTAHAHWREYDLPPSYLATRDPDYALRVLSARGWKSF